MRTLSMLVGTAVVMLSGLIVVRSLVRRIARWRLRNRGLWRQLSSAGSAREACWLLFDALNDDRKPPVDPEYLDQVDDD